jgi:DNA helicase-2/ATP-dependent DNA helicase PcrA
MQLTEQPMAIVAAEEETEEPLGEFQVAEYIIFILALDTYMRYAEETSGVDDIEDQVIHKGMRILRMAETEIERLQAFLQEHLETNTQQSMLRRALTMTVATTAGISRRALQFRTLLSRGGPATIKGIFTSQKYIRQVREAITASTLSDADAALDVFAALPIKNARMRNWIDIAAKQAGSGIAAPAPVDNAANEVVAAPEITNTSLQGAAASGASDAKDSQDNRAAMLSRVQTDATEAARKSLEINQQPDTPPIQSEVVGIATAAAVAAISDPLLSQNVPAPLRKLDDEQRAAAVTDGRVLVAAGAGAGKSTTLVARIEYLVKDRRVLPSRILATSFNKKAASELREKIGRTSGGDALTQMSVGTMHGLFRKFIGSYGTTAEQIAVGASRSPNGFIEGGASVARTVQRMWEECYGKDEPAPKLKDVMRYKSLWAGNNIPPAQARAEAKTKKESEAALWYEMYEGLKGAIPGWDPPCRGRAYEGFMARYRPRDIRLGDFDDMLNIFHAVLKREPAVRKTIQSMYDHIMVDEAQDRNAVQAEIIDMISEHIGDGSDGRSLWVVGDDKQCVQEDTPISIDEEHQVPAKDLKEGDTVLSYRNGSLVKQVVRCVKPSFWASGYCITTSSGRSLTMSPNHKIWAQSPVLSGNQVAVYLMFRKDFGFRVGITNKCHDEEYLNSFGGRAFMEKAERMWILEVCQDRETALLVEARYSLKYGVPTAVFGGENRGLNQDRIDQLFKEFGANGYQVLEAKHLSFDLPHWLSQSYTKHGRGRRTVQMTAHGGKGSQVSLEWSGDDLDSKLEHVAFHQNGERRRIRKWFASYREALDFAEHVSELAEANLSRRLSTDSGVIRLLTASGLFPGMQVAVLDTGTVCLEEILSVEEVKGSFIDLDVDDASNFFGGGILSHNSIYGFRGARPDLFSDLNGKEGWKTRMIRTNYRCEPEIVEAANRLVAHNEGQIPMEAVPSPHKTRGVGSIAVTNPSDEAEGAIQVASEIKANLDIGGNVTDNAVLCRTNREIHAYETACILRGIPYARKGVSSFLGSPETNAFLGYIQLVTGTDFEKMQKALGNIINRPNRFFISPKVGEEAVSGALVDYARSTRSDLKHVNPVTALQDRQFQRILAGKLTGTFSGFKFEKAVEQLQSIYSSLAQMQANSSDPGYTTKVMFDDILALNGVVTVTDPNTQRVKYVEQSLRETLQIEMRDATGDDSEDEVEDEDDETKGLGNIAFLYQLIQKDPTDPGDLADDPNTPVGFKAKIERYAAKMKDLRTDISKWDKEQESLPPEKRSPPPGVYLGTVHSVKGAQWANTYVSMPKGKFPFEPPKQPGVAVIDDKAQQDQEESERRLAYVALTRAAKSLTVICPKSVGGKAAGISPFVAEAGLTVGQNVQRPGKPIEAPVGEEEPIKTAEVLEWHPEYEETA